MNKVKLKIVLRMRWFAPYVLCPVWAIQFLLKYKKPWLPTWCFSLDLVQDGSDRKFDA